MTSRPPAIRWIVALAWLRVAAFVIVVLFAIAAVSPAGTEWMEGFRRGWLHRFGYSTSAYGEAEAGEIAGRALIPVALAAMVLIFVHLRKLMALRIVAGLSVLVSLTQPLGLLLTILTLVLTFRASTRAYCQGEPPSPSPAQPATGA
jgi:hypothetical protein